MGLRWEMIDAMKLLRQVGWREDRLVTNSESGARVIGDLSCTSRSA